MKSVYLSNVLEMNVFQSSLWFVLDLCVLCSVLNLVRLNSFISESVFADEVWSKTFRMKMEFYLHENESVTIKLIFI